MASTALKLSTSRRRSMQEALLSWYDANRRDLPWRATQDPYRIWVSEIMLQQTRVSAVVEYYRKFLERFPTVVCLAEADLQDVLALWSGLGYYRRARAMHAAAKTVVMRGGKFPRTPGELLELPGIGKYTAAAVASIAFQYPAAVVDGNVERVLTRLRGEVLTKSAGWKEAEEMLCQRRPGDWNQALMELGATVCTPMAPDCKNCPVRRWCVSKGGSKLSAQARRLKKEFTCGLARRGKSVWLVQRPATDSLMAGMWELPVVSSPGVSPVLLQVKHSITNSDYTVKVIGLGRNALAKGRWFEMNRLSNVPLTGLTRKILRKVGVFPESAREKVPSNN